MWDMQFSMSLDCHGSKEPSTIYIAYDPSDGHHVREHYLRAEPLRLILAVKVQIQMSRGSINEY